MATVVTNVASFITNLPQNIQQQTIADLKSSPTEFLVDYPNCGIRNNDTFNRCRPNYPSSGKCRANHAVNANANWSVECLWDCTWKVNPYLGKSYDWKERDTTYMINVTMPKVPVDLRCLDGCTVYDYRLFGSLTDPLICSDNSTHDTFLGCYISNRLGYGYFSYAWTVINYFDMAIMSCVLAIKEPTLYNQSTCDSLNVNLWIFQPYLPPSFPTYNYSVYSSIPNGGLPFVRLSGPASYSLTGSCLSCAHISYPSQVQTPLVMFPTDTRLQRCPQVWCDPALWSS